MKNIGKIGVYEIYWVAWSGLIYVGDEQALDMRGVAEVAPNQARAMAVAHAYIQRNAERRKQ